MMHLMVTVMMMMIMVLLFKLRGYTTCTNLCHIYISIVLSLLSLIRLRYLITS